MDIIEHFKFIDSVVLLILLRVLYIAIKNSLFCEFIKLGGVFFASFLSFQYYPIILRKFSSEGSIRQYLDFSSFFAIFITVILIFSFLRRLAMLLEEPMKSGYPSLKRWFSFFLGLVRASLLVSTFIFAFYLLPPEANPFRGSLSYKVFKDIAPKSYILTFGPYKKVVSRAQFNKEVKDYYEGRKILPRDSKKRNRS
jgi:uncharacterized membrane protein required for colicin V production